MKRKLFSIHLKQAMKPYLLLLILVFTGIGFAQASDCGCSPTTTEESLDDKLYTGFNYTFFTAEVISIQSAFHLEVLVKIEEVFTGSKFIGDISKPIKVYFDLRTACAIADQHEITPGNKLFISSIYNTMGRMLITNNCEAFFPASLIDTYHLRDYLNDLKTKG